MIISRHFSMDFRQESLTIRLEQCHFGTFSIIYQKKKIDYVDLEGINSPLRGQFKQSFGGENKIYYNLEIYNDEH